MARKVKLKNGTLVRYPNEKDLIKMMNQLASNEVLGSATLPSDASEAEKLKYKLCAKIVEFKITNQLTQKQLSEKLSLDESETSRILHYKIERYSIEKLLACASALYPNLTLEILAA